MLRYNRNCVKFYNSTFLLLLWMRKILSTEQKIEKRNVLFTRDSCLHIDIILLMPLPVNSFFLFFFFIKKTEVYYFSLSKWRDGSIF